MGLATARQQRFAKDYAEAMPYRITKGVSSNFLDSRNENARQNVLDYIAKNINNPWWNSLSKENKIALIDNYLGTEIKDWNNAGGLSAGQDYEYDVDAILADLNELSSLGEFPNVEHPIYSDYVQSSEDILNSISSTLDPIYEAERKAITSAYDARNAAIDEALASLNAEAASMRGIYENALKENSEAFSQRASGLLSNQYLANAQTYDALQSDMRKSRQNALEAGASAGLRLAGNVNALLTAQNKQSQTAMDTSNALAEMLLQQRQAASGIRSDYAGYMSGINRQRSQYGMDKADNTYDYNTRMSTSRANQRAETDSRYDTAFGRQESNYNRAVQGYNDTIRSYEDKAANMEGTNRLVGPYTTWAKYK